MVDRQSRKSRLQLLAMFGIGAATLAGSSYMYYQARDEGVWDTVNKGEFVQPPVALVDLQLSNSDGVIMLEGETWWLWVVAPRMCDEKCAHALHQLRQLQILLNKDADRVRRALLSEDVAAVEEALAIYPRLSYLQGDLSRLKEGIYIVDPIGNLVFWYPLDDAGEPVLKDLKRLLKLSQIG